MPLGDELSTLATAWANKHYLVENLVFKDQKVNLDGYRFKNCAFINCVLQTHTGNFKLEECFFSNNWSVLFLGKAATAVRLVSITDWSQWNSFLKAKIHPNGGVTIE